MSSPRSPVLPLLAVLVVAGVVGVWALGGDEALAIDESLPVFESPSADDVGARVGEIVPRARGVDGAPSARVTVMLRELARPLPERALPPICRLARITADQRVIDPGVKGVYVAGPAASPLATRFRGLQLVRFALAGGVEHYRVVRLVGGPSDEAVVVERGAEWRVRGTVVGAQGRALAGATLWLAGTQAVTDAAGEFEFDALPVGQGMPLVVRAPGHAARFLVLDRRRCAELERQPIALSPGATLRLRVYGLGPSQAGAEAVPPATISVVPVGGRDSRLLEYPFFMTGVAPLQVAADGSAMVEGLPLGVRVRLRVHHPEFLPLASDEVDVDRPEVSAVLHRSRAELLRGRIVDHAGHGIAGACLTARPGGTGLSLRGTGWLLPPECYVRSAATARSAADGGFAIGMPRNPTGLGLLTVEAAGHVGLEVPLPPDDDGALLRPLVLPASAAGVSVGEPSVVLTAGAGLGPLVEVTVVDAAGRRGPYPWLTEAPFELPLGRAALFRLGLLIDAAPVRTQDLLISGATAVDVGR